MPDYAAVLFRNVCMDVELNEARGWIKSVRPDVLIKRLGIQMRKSARWKFNGFGGTYGYGRADSIPAFQASTKDTG